MDAEPAGRRPLAHNFETYSLGRDVRSQDVSDERVVLSLVGPGARALLADPPADPEHACDEADGIVRAVTDVGVDLILPAGREAEVRAALDAPDASEEAAEVLRIESGRPRLGLDMDASTMPQEAGINERAVSFSKGCYVGQETVARLHYKGKPNRHLRGLRLGGPAQHGDPIVLGEKQVGTIGSVAESPRHGAIALALVRREAEPGAEVLVAGTPAQVVALPFG